MSHAADAPPAYRIDGASSDAAAFYRVACDPRRSVVVEACAGAGKTWMLVARIVRALLDGAEPQQVLAITFTRKAAGEMRQRLFELLHQMALATVDERVAALRERGLDETAARDHEPRLATLAERLLDGGRGVEIRTFHGWFGQLLRAAPSALLEDLGLAAELTLLEDTEEIEPRLWRRFLAAVADDPILRADHAELVRQRGRSLTRDWLRAALQQRVEIERADEAGTLECSVPSAGEWRPMLARLAHPSEAVMSEPLRASLLVLAALLGRGNATQQKAGVAIEQALDLACGTGPPARFAAVWAALHTKDGAPRRLWKDGGPAEFVEACVTLAELCDAIDQQAAHEEHLHMVHLSRTLLACYRALKREEGLADMADLESCAERMLADAEISGWVQERLDARLSHLLVDEFQDTNPTQWRALHAWLAGYAGAGGGGSGQRPLSVFLVGDPKQSIYRFRRADPRVFGEARAFLQQAMEGAHLSCDHTRRNAPEVMDALNAVFTKAQADAEFEGFRPHTTASHAAGMACCLPVVPRPAKAGKAPGLPGWRDSLTTPRVQTEDALRLVEARRVADEIAACLAGTDGHPPCLPGEVMVLARKRASLAHVAQALQERGIPCNAPSERELATLPEVRDMIALLDALVSPNHDLSLAHALRSPVFGAADEDLQALALAVREARQHPAPGDEVEGVSWWAVLLAGAGPGRPVLDRARALLPGWADAARSLPPHDLLDRVVAEGDLYARTAAAVPAALRGLALATLDALLGQALDLDGGRYATPYRFVRALKRRPLSLPAGAASHAVQLLTIHGAKGLEAEAVFLVDGRPAPPRAETATLLIDWPADLPQPLCCAFVASETRCPPSLRGLHAQERAGRDREELNGLYVAMTRAKRRLVVSANEPHVAAMLNGPWDRLAAAGVEVQAPQQTDTGLLPVLSDADAPIQLATLPSLAARPALVGSSRTAEADLKPDSGDDTELHRVGRAVHRVLEWQTAPEQLEAACLSACSSLGLAAAQARVVRSVVASILGSPACRPFFDPQQYEEAANELPLAWQGESLRLDRLVRRRNAEGHVEWWVLDYKMQFLPQDDAANVAQLMRYRDAVQTLQPGDLVRAGLIGGDGSLWVLPDAHGSVPR